MERSKDYKKFKTMKGNRMINPGHVRKLKESFEKNGIIAGKPILVNKKMEIVDGQHRFLALKELEMEIQYEILDGDGIEQAIVLNTNQSNWKMSDYVQSFAQQGIDCYRKLQKFEDKYQLGMSNSIDIFVKVPHSVFKTIKSGTIFDINPKANEIAEFILDCSIVPFYKTNKFCRSVAVIHRKLTPQQLKFIKDNIIKVRQATSDQEYLLMYENLLNRKKQPSNRITLMSK